MDEINLKKLHLQVRELTAWESFFSDVLDLNVAPTDSGLAVQLSDFQIHLKQGAAHPIEWEFSLSDLERESILSRWSFLQYRADNSITMTRSEGQLCFQIDSESKVVVHFESIHRCESVNSDKSAVRNF